MVHVCVTVQVCSSRPGEGSSKCPGLSVRLVSQQHWQYPRGATPQNPAAQQDPAAPGNRNTHLTLYFLNLKVEKIRHIFFLPSLQGWVARRPTPLHRRRSLTCFQTWEETSLLLHLLRLPALPTLPILHIFQANQVRQLSSKVP